MKTLHSIQELKSLAGPVFLSIGVFDGVHLGHRAVIQRALQAACEAGGAAAVLTFDPHPARLLRPDRAPRLLTSTSHKARLLHALGVENLLVIPFDKDFAATAPEAFIRELAAANELREICVGYEWSFGKNRAGNLALLERLGAECGFKEVSLPAFSVDGQIVSSTLIRSAIEEGSLDFAARCLGRPYSILGTVERGQQLGRRLGFPTANLSAHNEQFPPNGVYAVRAQWRDKALQGVVNIGVRPTIERPEQPQTAIPQRLLEFHIFDLDEDLYGEEIEVFFHTFLRPEQKFGGVSDLQKQIACDIRSARSALLLEMPNPR